MKRTWKIALVTAALVAGGTLLGAHAAEGKDEARPLHVRGGATTILEGGTGAPDFTPVITKLAFYWDGQSGDVECLAIAPATPAGQPGSGDFDTNVMYVTGPVTSAQVSGETAVLEGTATVTGLGAGQDEPFRLTISRGGPGATAVLEVSGFVFREIVLDGDFTF